MTLKQPVLATRTSRMEVSAIREILKVVSQPGMLSLAGGIPAPESFPVDVLRGLAALVFDKYSDNALQYGLTEGFLPLRAALATHLARLGINATAEQICISSGSQGVLDGIGKILISEGDCVGVEAPTYLGALQAFDPYGPNYVRLETDADGVVPSSLAEVLRKYRPKFVYLVPTFQNPTGRTLSLQRRQEIAAIIQREDALVIEDDPYCALRYRGTNLPPLKALAPDNVIYIGSFSKVFAPGLRIGYHVTPEPLRRWLVIAKQGVDLHTSSFNQAMAAEYLSGGHLDRNIDNIINLYGPKLDYMLDALKRHMPPGYTWSKPEGGMFVWVMGPSVLDVDELYLKAIERHVAFVPGRFFFIDPKEGRNSLRLNFTMATKAELEQSVSVLGGIFHDALSDRS